MREQENILCSGNNKYFRVTSVMVKGRRMRGTERDRGREEQGNEREKERSRRRKRRRKYSQWPLSIVNILS